MTSSSQIYCGIDFRMKEENSDIQISSQDDFSTIEYYPNLKQAIINRLKTNQGELDLHPDYGSQLNELIGSRGDSLVLSETRQYVREALLQEPRVQTINSIKATFQDSSNKQTILIDINVTPIGQDADPLNIIWNFFL